MVANLVEYSTTEFEIEGSNPAASSRSMVVSTLILRLMAQIQLPVAVVELLKHSTTNSENMGLNPAATWRKNGLNKNSKSFHKL